MTNGRISSNSLNPLASGGYSQAQYDANYTTGYTAGLAATPTGLYIKTWNGILWLPSSATTKTFQIPKQFNTALSFAIITGMASDYATANEERTHCRISLASADTVTITRTDSATNNNIQVSVQVVQLNSTYVNAVHPLEVTCSAATSAVSSSVNAVLARCAVLMTGFSVDSAAVPVAPGRSLPRVNKTGSDGAVTYTVTKDISSDAVTVSAVIIEFKESQYTTIQEQTITIAAASNNNTGTLSPAVTLANCWALWGGFSTTNTATTAREECNSKAVLTNTTTVTASRGVADATFTCTVVVTIVEGLSSWFQSTENLSLAFTTADTDITSAYATAVTRPELLTMWPMGSTFTVPTGDTDFSAQQAIITFSDDTLKGTRHSTLSGTADLAVRYRLCEGKL